MATGLKVWNDDGSLKFDVTTRITRLVGSVQTGNQDGYVDVPSQGNQVFFFIASNNPAQPTRGVPSISINAGHTRLSWAFVENTRTPCTIYYGLW
ncbi:hypothetical protein G9274_002529 [Stenotrophomonas rhizophila]|nr:hypothetical protein G9274_002529 [Stenotrophomonas rhizophila]